jgi:hypothetical protein
LASGLVGWLVDFISFVDLSIDQPIAIVTDLPHARVQPPFLSPRTPDNIYNKKALNLLGKNGEGHWALAAGQLLVGACFVIPQWLLGVRAKPGACVSDT